MKSKNCKNDFRAVVEERAKVVNRAADLEVENLLLKETLARIAKRGATPEKAAAAFYKSQHEARQILKELKKKTE